MVEEMGYDSHNALQMASMQKNTSHDFVNTWRSCILIIHQPFPFIESLSTLTYTLFQISLLTRPVLHLFLLFLQFFLKNLNPNVGQKQEKSEERELLA